MLTPVIKQPSTAISTAPATVGSVTGSQPADSRAHISSMAQQQGFTLLELLVVVVIVAILFTYTTLAIRSDSAEDIIKQEAQRMQRLVELASEESILRGEEYAIEFSLNGYRFLRFENNNWQPLSDDRILRERELPLEMELELLLEETEIVIDLAMDNSMDQGIDLDEEDDKKNKAEPQVFLLSSGEITPEFEIRFFILGVEASYLVNGRFDGSVEMMISDL